MYKGKNPDGTDRYDPIVIQHGKWPIGLQRLRIGLDVYYYSVWTNTTYLPLPERNFSLKYLLEVNGRYHRY